MKHTGAAAAAAMLPGRARAGAEKTTGKRPNILLIFSDQQHWRAMGFMDPFFETPHLDALAEESVLFERAFCTTPQCSPSRSSILTGLYPSKTGVLGNVGAAGGDPLDQPTIAPALQAAGYRTGYFGKWHLGDEASAADGWDEHAFKTNDPAAQQGALDFLRNPETGARPFALFVSINNPHDIYSFRRRQVTGGDIPLPRSWKEETFADKPAVQQQFMAEDQGRAIVGKPRAEWERYRDGYRTKTKLYDANVGAILDELKRQGLWDNTIVIATSDHGDMDTNHRLIFKGPFLYEHMVRIPLMIRVPPKFSSVAPRRVRDIDAVNVDLVPTLRDLCGLSPARSDGRSLAPLLGGPGAYKAREFVIGQYYSKQRWVNPIRMIRTGRFKFNRYLHWGDELYDLQNDPDELHNLANDPAHEAAKQELAAKLDQWIKDNHDPFYSQQPTTRSGKPLDRPPAAT